MAVWVSSCKTISLDMYLMLFIPTLTILHFKHLLFRTMSKPCIALPITVMMVFVSHTIIVRAANPGNSTRLRACVTPYLRPCCCMTCALAHCSSADLIAGWLQTLVTSKSSPGPDLVAGVSAVLPLLSQQACTNFSVCFSRGHRICTQTTVAALSAWS